MRGDSFGRAAECVERRYSKRLTWALLLASAGFVWLFNFSALPLSDPELIRVSGGQGLLDLMPYYTAQEAFAILGRYGAGGRELYLRFLAADFAFIPVYTLGLAFLMTRAVRAACPGGKSWLWLNLLPFGIGIFDDVEDFCILAMLGLYPGFSAPIGTLAGIATQGKNALTLLTVLTLFLLGRFLLGCRLARSIPDLPGAAAAHRSQAGGPAAR